MSETTENNDTKTQQEDDEKILDKARRKLDNLETGKFRHPADNNKMRKKLKRWLDRCGRRRAEDEETKEGELCYTIDATTKEIHMGRKARQPSNGLIETPYLKLLNNYWYITQKGENATDKHDIGIGSMLYEDFYKFYQNTVGLDGFRETFWDSWDWFMSWTQLQRQSGKNKGAPKDVCDHVADAATRVFSPVVGLSAGCILGVYALKEKVKEYEEKLERDRKAIKDEYMNRFNKENSTYYKGMYRKSVENIYKIRNISEKDRLAMLDKQIEWYDKYIFPKNLNSINVSNVNKRK